MAWLAKLDSRVDRWPAIWRGLYLLVKWSLVALGGFAWIMLWWERSVVLGVIQASLVISGVLREALLELRRQSRPDPGDQTQHPARTS